jgi:hypothetical protein
MRLSAQRWVRGFAQQLRVLTAYQALLKRNRNVGAGKMSALGTTDGRQVHLILAVALATVCSFSVSAADPVIDETPVAAEMVLPSLDADVVVTPIPIQPSVIDLAAATKPVVKLRPTKRSKLTKKKSLPTMMLSRTERHQMALLAPKPKSGEQSVRKQLHDQNGDGGFDELVFHRCFSRPKLVSESDGNQDIADFADLSDGIKLRLLIARMRAVEAHAMVQAADADGNLSDTVKQKLADARMRAVQAHQKKFG